MELYIDPDAKITGGRCSLGGAFLSKLGGDAAFRRVLPSVVGRLFRSVYRQMQGRALNVIAIDERRYLARSRLSPSLGRLIHEITDDSAYYRRRGLFAI